MVKRSRLSRKQKVGIWKRLKGDVRDMPYLVGGTAGLGASLAGSAVFPPLALGAVPSVASILYQLPSKVMKHAAGLDAAEVKKLKRMSKEQRYNYLMKTYSHGMPFRLYKMTVKKK